MVERWGLRAVPGEQKLFFAAALPASGPAWKYYAFPARYGSEWLASDAV